MKRCEMCGFVLNPPEENELYHQMAITGIKLSAICDTCKDELSDEDIDDDDELTINHKQD